MCFLSGCGNITIEEYNDDTHAVNTGIEYGTKLSLNTNFGDIEGYFDSAYSGLSNNVNRKFKDSNGDYVFLDSDNNIISYEYKNKKKEHNEITSEENVLSIVYDYIKNIINKDVYDISISRDNNDNYVIDFKKEKNDVFINDYMNVVVDKYGNILSHKSSFIGKLSTDDVDDYNISKVKKEVKEWLVDKYNKEYEDLDIEIEDIMLTFYDENSKCLIVDCLLKYKNDNKYCAIVKRVVVRKGV
jgi:hypothetical protein